MSKIQQNVCGNCKYWEQIDVDYGERANEDYGDCSEHDGEIMYSDDIACDAFEAVEKPRSRKRQ